MANNAFNEKVVPVLQPDPDHPDATVDRTANRAGSVEPRRGPPSETGFPGNRPTDVFEHPEQQP